MRANAISIGEEIEVMVKSEKEFEMEPVLFFYNCVYCSYQYNLQEERERLTHTSVLKQVMLMEKRSIVLESDCHHVLRSPRK